MVFNALGTNIPRRGRPLLEGEEEGNLISDNGILFSYDLNENGRQSQMPNWLRIYW